MPSNANVFPMAAINKAKIPVGFLISGKYRVTGELGRGGMAAVYEAENVDIGKRVAIKVLAQELISSAVVVERFLREARAVAAIRSPYICDVYDSGRLDDGRPFLVLELLEGESLYEQMIRVGQIDVPNTVAIVTQTCKGLVKAHAIGIVHRDLKPENIFVTHDEEGRVLAKILDFGLAKFYSSMEAGAAGQPRLTREGAVFGTPAYMSPEQVRGQGAVDSRADLWALACITYESLTGRTVWSTEQGVAMTFAQIANAPLPDPYALRPDLPEGFKGWFVRALDRNIDKRFQTPKEFADELLRAMSMAQMSSASLEVEDLLGLPSGQEMKLDPPFPSDPRASGTTTMPAPQPRSSRAAFAAPGSTAAGPRSSSKPFASQAEVASRAYGGPSFGRLVVAVGVVGILGAASYGAYRALVPQTPSGALTTTPSASESAPSGSSNAPSTIDSAVSVPQNGLPFRPLVAKAQDAIALGDLDGATKALKDAVQLGNHPFPATMLNHVAMAAKAGGVCKLTGLGRPRTYDLLEDKTKIVPVVSAPSIAFGPNGALVVWTENRDGNEQAYAVSVDDALRPRTVPFAVTPEGQAVKDPAVHADGDHFIITYWDASRGAEAGVYARFLDADGRIKSEPMLIGKASGGAAWQSLLPLPSAGAASSLPGRFANSWISPTERNTDDLFVRFTNEKLEPQGDPLRLSALQPGLTSRSKVHFPVSAVDPDAAHFAFRLEHEPSMLVEHLRVPWADLKKGVSMKDLTPKSPDTTVGEMALINTDKGRAEMPSMACNAGACYIVWNDEGKPGASIAYIEAGKSGPLWRKLFDKAGRHPAVVADGATGVQAFFYDGASVMTAPVDRDGVKDPTPLGHVFVDRPQLSATPPAATPGKKPSQWYVAWNEIEGQHFEVYVARTECK